MCVQMLRGGDSSSDCRYREGWSKRAVLPREQTRIGVVTMSVPCTGYCVIFFAGAVNPLFLLVFIRILHVEIVLTLSPVVWVRVPYHNKVKQNRDLK